MAVMFAGGDAGQWEWPASPTTEATSEHLHDVHEPGWAPLSLAVAADTPWPAVHLPAVPGRMEGHDAEALSYLDARDHPGVTVTMESIVVAAATGRVRALGGSLSEAEMRAVLTLAGWPVELHAEALAVAWCESRWSPLAVGDGSNSLGLFQLNGMWFPYAGEDGTRWADPLVNARTAYAVYQYDIGRGYVPWKQWSCRKVLP